MWIHSRNHGSTRALVHRLLSDIETSSRLSQQRYFTSSTPFRSANKTISPIQSDTKKYQFFASTLPGLETVLRHEIQILGLEILGGEGGGKDKGGIAFRASSIRDVYKCHLHLGTASHILLRTGEPFYATGMKELARKVGQMPFWKDYIYLPNKKRKKGRRNLHVPKFDIRVTTSKSRLYHTKGIAERVERGIIIALGIKEEDLLDEAMNIFQPGVVHETAEKESPEEERPVIKILVRVIKNKVEISVDTSSTPLHRRGYRLASGKAPLREDLAYGLLYSLGWSHNNVEYDPNASRSVVDPFCGSGTILIEGASMRSGLPPGRLRDPPFEHSRLFNRKRWNHMIKSSLADAENRQSSTNNRSIILGSDRDAGVIQSAKANIERAGVSDMIELECCAISSNRWFRDPSSISNVLVATNPPYGRRLFPTRGREFKPHPLLPLYQTLGKMDGHALDYGIIAHDVSLMRKSGINGLNALFTTQHGGLTVCALGTTKPSNIFEITKS